MAQASDKPATSILLIGYGVMGKALSKAILKLEWAKLTIVDPEFIALPLSLENTVCKQTLEDVEQDNFDIIILAVKPQNLVDVLPHLPPCSLILSIAAGKTIEGIKSLYAHKNTPVMRAMPNLPLTIGSGATALYTNTKLRDDLKLKAAAIFSASGVVVEVSSEDALDSVTALSGSGPAYLFALGQAMALGGQHLGLDENAAAMLARQTLIGAAEMLKNNPKSFNELIGNVSSKGGTTVAAMAVLADDKNGLPPLMEKALNAAKKRAEELRS